jgi:hypothetical protein
MWPIPPADDIEVGVYGEPAWGADIDSAESSAESAESSAEASSEAWSTVAVVPRRRLAVVMLVVSLVVAVALAVLAMTTARDAGGTATRSNPGGSQPFPPGGQHS